MSIDVNNYNKYNVQLTANSQAGVSNQPVHTPSMNGGIADSALVKSFDKSKQDQILTYGLMAPFTLLLAKLHAMITNANNGEYEKSLIGKIAKFGDKLSDNSVTNSSFGQKVRNFISWTKDTTKNIINKSSTLSAMVKTPSVPEYAFVKSAAHGAVDEVLNDFVSFVERHVKDGGKLTDLGLNETQFNKIKANPSASLEEIKDICKKVGNKHSVTKGKFLGKFLSKNVSLEQIGNRLRAMTDSSSIGKFLAKSANRGAFGLFVGGGLFMLMSAHAIAEATVRAKNAEKGDKFPTFMEGFLGNISWVVTFPLGIKLMNAVAGLKYHGMSPEQVAKYRDALKAFNLQAEKGFASKAEYKQAYQAVKDAFNVTKNGGTKSFWNKLVSLPGRFLSYGREVAKPFIQKDAVGAQKMGNFMRKIPKFIRNHPVAILIGFGTYMGVFSPFVENIFRKCSYAIFGKPKHSMYDEEPEAQNVETTNNTEQTVSQDSTQTATNSVSQNPFVAQSDSPTNLLNMYKNGVKYVPPANNTTSTTSTTSTTNITNIQNKTEDDSGARLEQLRTYIPSPEGVKVNGEDPTAAQKAIERSMSAEKLALDTLAMK